MGKLYQILEWSKEHGEVKSVDRIRVKVLTLTIKEKLYLGQVGPDTECSPELLAAIRRVASEVVGKRCPF
jgi:hypothetical protein